MSKELAKKHDNALRELLSTENVREQIGKALPRHLTTDRFLRVAMTALIRTPKLAQCDRSSFMKCLLDLSSYGLEPDGRRAHLIPFENRRAGITECTLIIDWKGLAELALRSGMIAKLHADLVCENDEFAFDIGEVLHHRINFKAPRGEPYAAYAIAETKDGAKFCQVMTKEEIEKIRDNSQGYKAAVQYKKDSPWLSSPGEMWKKTAFRRLSKWLPLSADFRDAVERDDDDDRIPERDITPEPPSRPKLFAPKKAATEEIKEQEEQQEQQDQEQEPPASDAGESEPSESPPARIGEPTALSRLHEAMDADTKSFSAIKDWLRENGLDKPKYKDVADLSANTIENILAHWDEVEV